MNFEFQRLVGPGRSDIISAPAGSTVSELAASIGGAVIAEYLTQDGEWKELKRKYWNGFRPKKGGVIRFWARMHGGEGGQLLALVATIAIAVAAPYLGPAIAGALGYAADSFLASALTAGIAVGGSFLVSALFPVEPQAGVITTAPAEEVKRSNLENVEADGNLLARDSYLPRVFGQSGISPPDVVNPHSYLDAGVQTVEKVLALDRGHLIEDIRIDGILAADMPAVTIETRDGQPGTSTITMVDRITASVVPAAQLSAFSLDDTALEDQSTPSNSSPIPHRFRTRLVNGMSEIAIRLRIDALIKSTDPTQAVRLPIRIRYRIDGGDSGDWIKLPEIHIVGIEQASRLIDIRIRRDNTFGVEDIGGSLTYQLFQNVPEVTNWDLADGSSGDQWQAHANFISGSGLQDTQNVIARRHGLRVTATEDIFPAGAYEFEINRGIVTDDGWLNTNNYRKGGDVVSLFVARNEGTTQNPDWHIPVAQNDYPARVSILSATVITKTPPIQRPRTTAVAIRSRGQSIRNVSMIATGYAKNWNGSAWADWEATRNPALHTRQLLEDVCRHFRVAEYSRFARIAALSESLLVDTDWIGWRDQCTAMGATCSLISAGDGFYDVLDRLLSSGLARRAAGSKLRIDWFRDRSVEQPALTFSPRNSPSIRIIHEDPQRPMGYRAKFRNRELNWEQDELEVRTPISGNTQNWRRVEIRAIDDPAWLRQRLEFDMLRAHYWRARYEITSEIEGMAVKPGTLIGVITDLVDDTAFGARIRRIDSEMRTIVLDQIAPKVETVYDLEWIDSLTQYEDLFEVGEQSVIQIVTPTGSVLKSITDADADGSGLLRVTLDSALSSADVVGQHVSIGSLSNQVRRSLVVEESAGDKFKRTLIAADERPEIYDYLSAKYGWS